MRLVISDYIRTLKERGELDVLLPQLLLAMSIVPLSKTQTGTRQFGVDLAAAGQDPDDRRKKLFLFVVKCGDIGRAAWDSSPQSVRQSLNEIFDSYLRSCVRTEHQNLPVCVVVVTSGQLKEEVNSNLAGYAEEVSGRAEIKFWGADLLALLVEKYLLSERIFNDMDRADFRRALAMAGEVHYQPDAFFKIVSRQLGLDDNSSYKNYAPSELRRKLKTVNLTTRIYCHWAIQEENSKQALIASERSLLWSWHSIREIEKLKRKKLLFRAFRSLEDTYLTYATLFLDRLEPHYFVRDGVSLEVTDNAALTTVLFEHLGILASIGLFAISRGGPIFEGSELQSPEFVERVANSIEALICNNASAASPRLDEQVIDIDLAMLFLVLSGKIEVARTWLSNMAERLIFSFSTMEYFPLNSYEELVTGEVDYELSQGTDSFIYLSWMLPTVADWSVLLNQNSVYESLFQGSRQRYPKVCQQLWHPDKDYLQDNFYCPSLHTKNGFSEAPIVLPSEISMYRQRIRNVLSSDMLNHCQANLLQDHEAGAGFVSCRHFRTLVPPYLLYQIVTNVSGDRQD